METFSALLAFCAGNPPVTGGFPAQRPLTRGLDVFFDVRLEKRLNKQWRRRWFETLWCPCDVNAMMWENDKNCFISSDKTVEIIVHYGFGQFFRHHYPPPPTPYRLRAAYDRKITTPQVPWSSVLASQITDRSTICSPAYSRLQQRDGKCLHSCNAENGSIEWRHHSEIAIHSIVNSFVPFRNVCTGFAKLHRHIRFCWC